MHLYVLSLYLWIVTGILLEATLSALPDYIVCGLSALLSDKKSVKSPVS